MIKTLVVLSLVLSLTGCVTWQTSSEYYRKPDNDVKCMNGYGGMDGYCSKP